MTAPGSSRESGSATVLVLAATAGVALVTFVLLAWASGLVGAARARAAVDFAALAGASAVFSTSQPCVVAERVARSNGAVLVSCAVDGPVVLVTVRVRGPAAFGDATARARAGPAAPESAAPGLSVPEHSIPVPAVRSGPSGPRRVTRENPG